MTAATVLIPTHEHVEPLRHAVASAQAQTLQDIELFIVGDGVTDATRALVAGLSAADPRIRLFDFPKGRHDTPGHDVAARRLPSCEIVLRPIATTMALNQVLNISISELAMDFEWDGAKELANRNKHGVDFRTAAKVFLDPYVVEFDDLDAAGELRFNAIGLVDDRMLFVSYTMRGDIVRIISARGAEPHEKRKYHEI